MNKRDQVLTALRSADSRQVSGEAIAQRLGISRTAVSKYVAALRQAGYVIDSRVGSGYQLLSAPDLMTPAEVVPLLSSDFWAHMEGREETGSTNDDARILAEQGACEGTVVLAARQTRGRGRFRRTWESPTGGIYFSAVLRPAVPMSDLAPLPLVIALGTAHGLAKAGAKPGLKWPNDVLLCGRKVAGILLEVSGQPDRVDWVVAGVGINVLPPGGGSGSGGDSGLSGGSRSGSGSGPGSDSDSSSGSDSCDRALAESAGKPTGSLATGAFLAEVVDIRVAEVAAMVLDEIARVYRLWQKSGFSVLREEFIALHVLQKQNVVVRDITGAMTAEGKVLGVDEFGRLAIRMPTGNVTHVSAGEASLRCHRHGHKER